MTSVPVWISWSDYMCCGTPRRVGDMVEMDLTFVGDVEPSSDPERIDVLDGDQIVVVGGVVGPVEDEDGHTYGTLVRCGDVMFGIEGAAPAGLVRCSGSLGEMRHSFSSGRTDGHLIGIRWLPEITRQVADSEWASDGYGPAAELSSTEDWSWHVPDPNSGDGTLMPWALVLTVEV